MWNKMVSVTVTEYAKDFKTDETSAGNRFGPVDAASHTRALGDACARSAARPIRRSIRHHILTGPAT